MNMSWKNRANKTCGRPLPFLPVQACFGFTWGISHLPGRSELSELLIHMGDGGARRVDGPGRHGPGNMLFTYFEDADRNLLEWVTEVQQIDEATHQPRAWDPAPALNLWRSPQHVGPPRGFRWLLNLLPVISKLSRFRPRTPSQQVQCK